ncbi:hypothetical protein E4U43_006525 [Claviceps pusilla]|uniref:Hydrophobin n=1 Tax=Claviceps pusilla TaxID=123648 RepID=A0A9P7N393_9HYPO|nr:hypothetical protein E4U43_006525 [Claviceps pusilla]
MHYSTLLLAAAAVASAMSVHPERRLTDKLSGCRLQKDASKTCTDLGVKTYCCGGSGPDFVKSIEVLAPADNVTVNSYCDGLQGSLYCGRRVE